MKERLFLCLLTAILLLLTGCRQTAAQTVTFYDLFDTAITFTAYAEDAVTFQDWTATLKSELTAVHQAADPYHTYAATPNNLCTVNASAGTNDIPADQTLTALLQFGADAFDFTEGKVNVALGRVTALWKNCRDAAQSGTAQLPSQAELENALKAADFSAVSFSDNTITLPAGVALDFGAVAKGWATEKAANLLESKGCVGLITAGGTVRTIGEKPNGAPWTVRIAHTLENDTYSLDVYIGDKTAVATSGDYQRYYAVDGVTYSHIIDPQTGYPPRYMRAVTVICDDAGFADALSTALFLMPIDKAINFTNNLEGVEAVFLDNDLNWRYSDGFSQYIK
ncbi:MAG: FAD:protein FMN transferase [Clostridia bacterium]|nr:FAD:protein FMN transferase [Clostridia bacterium]